MSIRYPFGDAAVIALTATGAQDITIEDRVTIIDGVTVAATGNRTLNITNEAEVAAGDRLFVKSKTAGTQTTIFGTGMIGSTITGVAGKTKVNEFIYDGTNWVMTAAAVQID